MRKTYQKTVQALLPSQKICISNKATVRGKNKQKIAISTQKRYYQKIFK